MKRYHINSRGDAGVLLKNEATPDKVRDGINAEMQRLKNLLEESQ